FHYTPIATPPLSTLSLHDALPICAGGPQIRYLPWRQARNSGVSDSGKIAKRTFHRPRCVHVEVVALQCSERIGRAAAEVALQERSPSWNEYRVSGNGLRSEEHTSE